MTVKTVNDYLYCQQTLGCRAYERLAMTYNKFHALLPCETVYNESSMTPHLRIICRAAARNAEVTIRCKSKAYPTFQPHVEWR
jgi:hypothetical protein